MVIESTTASAKSNGTRAAAAMATAQLQQAAAVSVSPFGALATELAAGTAGGTAQLCVGHPFDTTKVKLQRMSARLGTPNALTLARETVAKEGLRGLYAGIQAPLPFVMVFNATLFSTNEGMRSMLHRARGTSRDSELGLGDIAVAGCGAGAAVSIVACPTELVKCRMQVHSSRYTSAIGCAREIIQAQGMRGLFTGFGATLAREIPGTAIYFAVYEGLLRQFRKRNSDALSQKTSPLQCVAAGAMAGVMYWGTCYPIDFAKTQIQTDSWPRPKYNGVVDCILQTARKHGVRALFKGVGPALARAGPATAVTFLVYEAVKDGLSGNT